MAPSKDVAGWLPNTTDKAESDDNNTKTAKLFEMTDTAKTLIVEHEISDEDVSTIVGTGKDGKLTKADVSKYLVNKEKNTDESERIPTLIFANSGWCEKLNKSYRMGIYQPKTQKEHDALKPFAMEDSK